MKTHNGHRVHGALRRAVCLGLALVAPLALAAARDEYPGHKPILLTVLFAAGTSADVTARVLAEGMSKRLGTNVVPVNRPGGGGSIGYKFVAAQNPDGYHIVWNSNSISTTYHTGMIPMDYRAFEPVARVLVETPLLAVRSDARWKSLGDMIADAKSNPGKLTVGNSGSGSHTHFSAVALFRTAGAEVIDVPYAGAQVIPGLLGGHVNSVLQLPGALAPHVKSGSIRLLAAITAKRDPSFPDVPTAQELGVKAVADAWRGIAAPKGTPKAVLARLESVIRDTIASPEFVQACERLSVTPAFLPGAEFGKLIAREDPEIAQMITALGLAKKH